MFGGFMQPNWPTAQKEVVYFLVLEFLFGNVLCLVGLLFLYYRIVGFEIFFHNHLYVFQEASTEVGFHMAFTKVCSLVIPHTPSSAPCPTHSVIPSHISLRSLSCYLCSMPPSLPVPRPHGPLKFPYGHSSLNTGL